VGLALGKVPDVTKGEFIDLILAVLVNSGHKDTTLVYEAPFSLFLSIVSFHQSNTGNEKSAHHSMPMKLTNGALLQVLLRSRNVMALRQVLHDLLTNPASREDLSL
jgi:hypothetical protein